jgi:hypothetical protein
MKMTIPVAPRIVLRIAAFRICRALLALAEKVADIAVALK